MIQFTQIKHVVSLDQFLCLFNDNYNQQLSTETATYKLVIKDFQQQKYVYSV